MGTKKPMYFSIPIMILRIFIAVIISAIVSYGIYGFLTPDKYDPFGDYPVQTIEEPITEITDEKLGEGAVQQIPTISLSQQKNVHVRAVKCLNEDTVGPIYVEGEVTWQGVDPMGFHKSFDIQETRNSGCETISYIHQVPIELVFFALERFDEGEEYIIVNIIGYSKPIVDDGNSVTKKWRTENFALIP